MNLVTPSGVACTRGVRESYYKVLVCKTSILLSNNPQAKISRNLLSQNFSKSAEVQKQPPSPDLDFKQPRVQIWSFRSEGGGLGPEISELEKNSRNGLVNDWYLSQYADRQQRQKRAISIYIK